MIKSPTGTGSWPVQSISATFTNSSKSSFRQGALQIENMAPQLCVGLKKASDSGVAFLQQSA
jgi:hypothetical protein